MTLQQAQQNDKEIQEAIEYFSYITNGKSGHAEPFDRMITVLVNFATLRLKNPLMIYDEKNGIRPLIPSLDGICYYCGKPTNSLAGNPSEWPVMLCHTDEPGKVKHHHTGCVMDRLIENQPKPSLDYCTCEEPIRGFEYCKDDPCIKCHKKIKEKLSLEESLKKSMKDIPAEYAKLINDNFWKLI